MTSAMEHFEDKGLLALQRNGSWSFVMNVVTKHCDDR